MKRAAAAGVSVEHHLATFAMRDVPVTNRHATSQSELDWFREQLRGQRTLGDVFDWLRRQAPPRNVTEILTQDEYTHDVIVEWTPQRFLVFDAT
jgi:hypothetical protein